MTMRSMTTTGWIILAERVADHDSLKSDPEKEERRKRNYRAGTRLMFLEHIRCRKL